jgi:hypothetical protein
MTTSEISNENVIMASFDDVPEEARKAFEEHKKAREEKVSHPVPRNRERSLHTCAQDVQITRMATI